MVVEGLGCRCTVVVLYENTVEVLSCLFFIPLVGGGRVPWRVAMFELLLDRELLPVLLPTAALLLVAGYVLGDWLASRRHQQRSQELELQAFQAEQEWQQLLKQHQDSLNATEQQLELHRAGLRTAHERLAEIRQRLEQREGELAGLREQADTLRAELAASAARFESRAAVEAELRDRLGAGEKQRSELTDELGEVMQELRQLSEEHVELKTTLARKEEHFAEQLQLLDNSRQRLAQEFETVAGRLFEEKGRTFAQNSQVGIEALLGPLREQIGGFQQRLNEVHDAAVQGNASLSTEIRKVLETGLQMSADANSLVQALKGDAQQRGAWGEAQLRRTLELGGLVEGEHYEAQSSFRDEEGRLRQTDFLIFLPDGKHIVLDSKVTLNAYARLLAAENPEQERLALAAHIQAVRRHIDDLAGKDYGNLSGLHSPGFVLMFMPVEPAFIEALRQDPELYEYGFRKNVVLVSHTTLIPVLRTVSALWMLDRSQRDAREISDRAGDIFNQVCVVAERVARLGNTLGTVSNHYNSVVTALAGQQGLHGKVERFAGLSARVSKSMPQLEPQHLEHQTGRLPLADGQRLETPRT